MLCGGLLLGLGLIGLAWGQDGERTRSSYGSYGEPVVRPVLPTPGQGLAVGALSEPSPSAAVPTPKEQLAQARRLLGQAVTGRDGAALGTVRGIARAREGAAVLHAVVAITGFLGLDKKHVLVPVERLTPQADKVWADFDQDELERMLEYQPELFDLVLPGET
ncbi:MAG: hypothetical protein GX093_03185 [Xanthomonadaceae bacterium]|nr:hypothetical protein [Xanthomonadaceae bacterium]